MLHGARQRGGLFPPSRLAEGFDLRPRHWIRVAVWPSVLASEKLIPWLHPCHGRRLNRECAQNATSAFLEWLASPCLRRDSPACEIDHHRIRRQVAFHRL